MKHGYKFENIQLYPVAASHKSVPNDLIDDVESQILMQYCRKYDAPKILEIGTYKGGTTTNLLRAIKHTGGLVTTVDVKARPLTLPEVQNGEVLAGTNRKDEIGCLIPEELRDSVEIYLIEPITVGLLNLLSHLGRKYDVIFIDGDHSYEGVKNDFDTCKKFLKQFGVIFMHDVWWDVEPPPVVGPLKLAEEVGATILNYTHIARLT